MGRVIDDLRCRRRCPIHRPVCTPIIFDHRWGNEQPGHLVNETRAIRCGRPGVFDGRDLARGRTVHNCQQPTLTAKDIPGIWDQAAIIGVTVGDAVRYYELKK